MRGRTTRASKPKRREPRLRSAPVGKATQHDRRTRVLEEWLAESRIRYTHAGE